MISGPASKAQVGIQFWEIYLLIINVGCISAVVQLATLLFPIRLWNASDNLNNQWDDGTYGNYWGDYTGPDTNGDGIGDAPYYISEGKSVDRYPLMESPEI